MVLFSWRQLPEASVEGLERSPSGNGVRRHVATRANHTGLPKPLPAGAIARWRSERQLPGDLDCADIDASLQEIGNLSDLDVSPTPSGRRRRQKISQTNISSPQKLLNAIIVFILIIVLTASWFAYRALMASKSVFKGDLFGLVQQKTSQTGCERSFKYSYSRYIWRWRRARSRVSNWLDDGAKYWSKQEERIYGQRSGKDLYVKYGRACDAGYAGKINVYFNCVNNDWKSDSAEDERQKETRSFVGEILGMDLQYSVHVN